MADWKSMGIGAAGATALAGAAYLGNQAGKKKGFQRGLETAALMNQVAQPEEKVAGEAFWQGFEKRASWMQTINKGLNSFGQNVVKPMATNAGPMMKHYGTQAVDFAKRNPVATAGAALGAGYLMGRRGRQKTQGMPQPPAAPRM